ncbi:hypothetical protein ACTIVE_4540 [Actinomadura verrucosospora]|uniref:Integral membrane protein n=1 Tax=Actinomadura verrucosospora TaxID=46165 RepID=A0A7D3VU41_ACTVE|nr:hypothetical protein ACTIVE_4540 [Actinomadura verrucosospora]
MIDPLAGGLVMAVSGALGLAVYVIVKSRRALPFRSLSPYERVIVYRLALGNVSMNVGYVYGVQSLGIGAIATMTAMGPLCIRAKVLWARRRSRNGALHIALRIMALIGVFVVNESWKEFGHFHADMIGGIACGILGAWSFWNYLRAFFGDVVPEEERTRIVAVADVISLPVIALTVWVAGLAIGGGYSALLSSRVLVLGTVAGVLAFLVPTILTSIAAGKVSESVSGMLYVLDSPLGSLVGLVGAHLGLLGIEQKPNGWHQVGTGVVATVALVATILPFPNSDPPHHDLPAKER